MKKLLLSLGAVAAVVAPVATVVACSSDDAKTTTPKETVLGNQPTVISGDHVLSSRKKDLSTAFRKQAVKHGAYVKLSSAKIEEMIAKVKLIGTIKDEDALRAALADQSLATISEFRTSAFITLNADVTSEEIATTKAA